MDSRKESVPPEHLDRAWPGTGRKRSKRVAAKRAHLLTGQASASAELRMLSGSNIGGAVAVVGGGGERGQAAGPVWPAACHVFGDSGRCGVAGGWVVTGSDAPARSGNPPRSVCRWWRRGG